MTAGDSISMLDAFTILIIAGTFLIAGTVKGVIGLGLPTVSLALLTVAIGLPEAMNLLLVPSLATNLWQAAVGGRAMTVLRRIMALSGDGHGDRVARRHRPDPRRPVDAFGAARSAPGGLRGPRFERVPLHRPGASGDLGWAAGRFGQRTFDRNDRIIVVPGVMFLQAIGLSHDMLVQAMACCSPHPLCAGLRLARQWPLSAELGGLSAAALIPAALGMAVGQRVRRALSEPMFRRLFFISLLALGGYIMVNALRSV